MEAGAAVKASGSVTVGLAAAAGSVARLAMGASEATVAAPVAARAGVEESMAIDAAGCADGGCTTAGVLAMLA